MRSFAAVVALLLAAQPPSQQTAHPQLAAAPPPLVEKIDVSVVNIDVSVTDRKGAPVLGLTRNDFEIFEDGKPQPVSNFYAVENALPRLDKQAAAASDEPAPEKFRRRILVLVDNVNTSVHGRNTALEKLDQFINEHFDDGRYDWSVAAVDNRIHLLVPMTSDKTVLHNAVAEIRLGGTQREMMSSIRMVETSNAPQTTGNLPLPWKEAKSRIAEDASEGNLETRNQEARDENKFFNELGTVAEQTMFARSSTRAIIEAARAFGSSDGRKIILLVTGGLPLGETSPLQHQGSEERGNRVADMTRANTDFIRFRDQMVREANASNTSFYIINAEGLDVRTGSDNMSSEAMGAATTGSSAPDTAAMYWMSRETGGAYMSGNRIDESLANFDRRSANFYSLGFMSKQSDDTMYHRLVVRVKGHGDYRLQYRDGYSNAAVDLQLVRTLRSPLAAAMQPSTLAMSLVVGEPVYRGVVAIVPLKAAMTMESLQYITDARGSRTRLHVYVSIFDKEGRNIVLAKSFADIAIQPNEPATGPMTVTIPPLELAKGTYRLVVAVRDELTDHVGLVEQKIDI